MYSGITTNNPGQKYECEHKTLIGDPYHYFLISLKISANNVNTFTGICVPIKCQKHDIELALKDILHITNAEVYDYPADPKTDGLLIACAVIVGIWVGVLVLWSAFVSFR